MWIAAYYKLKNKKNTEDDFLHMEEEFIFVQDTARFKM